MSLRQPAAESTEEKHGAYVSLPVGSRSVNYGTGRLCLQSFKQGCGIPQPLLFSVFPGGRSLSDPVQLLSQVLFQFFDTVFQRCSFGFCRFQLIFFLLHQLRRRFGKESGIILHAV